MTIVEVIGLSGARFVFDDAYASTWTNDHDHKELVIRSRDDDSVVARFEKWKTYDVREQT